MPIETEFAITSNLNVREESDLMLSTISSVSASSESMLSDDADTDEIVESIKSDSSLTFKLLVMANSVSMGIREHVDNVRKAISVVGRNQIKRWVQLAGPIV